MQKKLIALAVAGLVAAPAFAQSNVSIGGYLSLSYKNMKLGNQNNAATAALGVPAAGGLNYGGRGATASSFQQENRLDDDWNSRFWLTGSEDIGGGNKAVFRIEQRLNLDMGAGGTGNGFAAGESYLGLQTKDFGLFTAGRRHVYFTEGVMWDAVWGQSTSNFTFYGIMTQGFNGAQQNVLTRTNNLLTWQSPNWNGFKARLDYSFNPYGDEGKYAAADVPGYSKASDYNKGSLWSATFNYDNGPWSAFFSYIDSKIEGRAEFNLVASPLGSSIGQVATNDWRGYKGGVKYMLPLAGGTLQLAAMVDRTTIKNLCQPTVFGVGATVAAATAANWAACIANPALVDDVSRTSWILPVKYMTGPHTFSLSYAQAGKSSNVADSKAKMYNLGYQYALSKRSYVGVNYAELKNGDGAAYQIPLAYGSTLSGSASTWGEKARVFSATFAHLF